MDEVRLDGGDIGGAVRAGDTVRRATGPWTPAVHALLAHLAAHGFTAAPRPLRIDGRAGRSSPSCKARRWDVAGPVTREWDLPPRRST
ncbi:hypothetical protein F8568_002610 [Actinomadura sp. LD22]|uniref:Aminoglycoside phosphotransferase family protein n=1 Tax=Actinomadura physcomitrii TaxID=2650748 RepID=A0A6I4MB00_9ACTN|nr:hypothetical protein [Actinomadura physcomitrii]MVZ99295.1 hypothetical protein [Actinomadura physcomitrii]